VATCKGWQKTAFMDLRIQSAPHNHNLFIDILQRQTAWKHTFFFGCPRSQTKKKYNVNAILLFVNNIPPTAIRHNCLIRIQVRPVDQALTNDFINKYIFAIAIMLFIFSKPHLLVYFYFNHWHFNIFITVW